VVDKEKLMKTRKRKRKEVMQNQRKKPTGCYHYYRLAGFEVGRGGSPVPVIDGRRSLPLLLLLEEAAEEDKIIVEDEAGGAGGGGKAVAAGFER
jgi:hypothetical protein